MSLWVGMTALTFVLAVQPPVAAAETDSEAERLERELYEACPALREFDEEQARVVAAIAEVPNSPRFAVDSRLHYFEGSGFRLVLEITVDDRTQHVREDNDRCEELLELALRHIRQIGAAPPGTGVSTELMVMPFVDFGSTPGVTGGGRMALQLRFGTGSLVFAADVLIPQTGSIQGTGGSISAMPLSLGVLGCGRPLAEDVSLDLCGGLLAGAVLTSFDGVDTPSDVGFLLAVDATVLLGFRLIGGFSFLVSADLLVPLVRPAYAVAGVSDPVTTSEVVAGRVGVGLAVRL